MIVSFAHNFIFFKTRKTAGTTVELVLSSLCGEQDIITPVIIDDENFRMDKGWRNAQNFSGDRAVEREYLDIVHRQDRDAQLKFLGALEGRGDFYNHMPAREAIEKIDPAFWSSALKFTTERHPYEKAVSSAFFHLWIHKLPPERFSDIVDHVIEESLTNDRPIYCIGGRPVANEVLRQEELAQKLPQLLLRLGLTFNEELPRAKSKIRTDLRPAREILTASQRERIYRQCRKTFDLLAYEP